MDKYEGHLLKVGSVNSQGVKFSEDCKIEFPETVPVVWNYHADEISLTRAFATVHRDSEGLSCECYLETDDFGYLEYFVGGYYSEVQFHRENDVTVITSCKLEYIAIIPEESVIDRDLKVKQTIHRFA